MDIYHFTEYKSYILNKIEENRHIKAYRSGLAKAAGCGRSFMSQALNSEIQLTPDHGAGLCAYWNLDDERTDYFLDLMHYERAASKQLRARLSKKLEHRRRESKRLASRLAPVSVVIDAGLKEAIYYSSWHIAAIHALTAIPGFQNVPAMARRLDLPSSLVERTLRDLTSIGLVEAHSNEWIIKGGSIHLPRESPLSTVNQINWRNQAMRHLGSQPTEGIHYSALFALSGGDAEKLQQLWKDLLDKSLKLVAPSKEEELVCLNIDYFPV